MADRQIVAKGQGQLTPITRDPSNLTEWQLSLEQSLFAHLQRMIMEPDFLLEIEQKTEACFNLLMVEGVQQLQQHAANLSVTADNELAVFKQRAGLHVEERIHLASAAAHAQASIHAKQLQNDTEYHLNQQLKGLIAEAKDVAAEFAVAEVKTSLDRADTQIEQRASHAVEAMIKNFDAEARARIMQLLAECYSSARVELQAVAEGHMVGIRKRVNEEIDRTLSEVRQAEERSAFTAIQVQAAEETRMLTATIGGRLDDVFREVQRHQARALAALDERADGHSTMIQQAVQRHVRTTWDELEAKFRASISTDVASRLFDHSREMGDHIDERIREALRSRKRDDAIQSMVKSFVQQEHDAHQKHQEELVNAELQRGLLQLEHKIGSLIADATSKPVDVGLNQDFEERFESIKSDVREAVKDLDQKISEVSRSVAVASSTGRKDSVEMEKENMVALVRKQLHEALGAIDKKINAAAQGSESAASSPSTSDSKESFDVGIATRIQQEVQTAVESIDARLQADLRRSLASRLPAFATDKFMGMYEQELASLRRDFQGAIDSVESKISHSPTRGYCPRLSPATSDVASPSGLSASIVLASGAGHHEIVIRSRPDPALSTKETPQLESEPKSVTPIHQRLEAESRAIERAMQDAWDAAADDPDGPDEPTELRVLTPPRIEAFLKQFETYKKAGGTRAWTGFVRPGLLAFVRSCELSDDASDDAIFAYLQLQVTANRTESTVNFVKLFETVVADKDAATVAEQVQSVLMGMEEILARRQRDGLDALVPIEVYGQIALSKLPRGFKDRAGALASLTTKREIKRELMRMAAQFI